MDVVEAFEQERPRLVRLAAGVLDDHAEAQDVVQHAWLRLDRAGSDVDDLPAWLTTVTTRLCLDRLRTRTPDPVDTAELDTAGPGNGVEDEVALADSVGAALHVVLDALTPQQRVAFVLHDSFDVDFATIATVLETTPSAARKLASRARTRVRGTMPDAGPSDKDTVDAFMAAARDGEFQRLMDLLAPDATVAADAAAVLLGTPERIVGRRDVATFFNGAAHAALPVDVDGRPAAAWYNKGEAKVIFDFTLRVGGTIGAVTFRAEPAVLDRVTRR